MTADDLAALYTVSADSDIMQHYPHTLDESRVRRWIDRNIERYKAYGFGLRAVCMKANGKTFIEEYTGSGDEQTAAYVISRKTW